MRKMLSKIPLLRKIKNYFTNSWQISIPKTKTSLLTEYVFKNRGYCYGCNQNVEFIAKTEWLRDNYICDHCGSIPRERAVMYTIDHFLPDWRTKIIHESSPVARGTSLRLKCEAFHYFATQYFPGIERGKMHQGFLNEDLEQLTFDDESIDLHVTQDVFEHVLDPAKAFREIARTLKPGGTHIFTTPLLNKNFPTLWCAKRNPDGTIQHLIDPPEYHGNPVSADGSLVTVHWGYDIVKFIYDTCGLFTEMIYIDSLDLGIRAELNEVLITRKPVE